MLNICRKGNVRQRHTLLSPFICYKSQGRYSGEYIANVLTYHERREESLV